MIAYRLRIVIFIWSNIGLFGYGIGKYKEKVIVVVRIGYIRKERNVMGRGLVI